MITAAMAHLNLVMIHPFSDGNGRMGRCLQTLVIARTGMVAPPFASIEEYLGRNTRAYYDVLAEVGQGAWHPERDARPWIRFCLTAHFRQAKTLHRRTRQIERIYDELEAIVVRKYGLPERAVPSVADAAVGFKIRNPSYRKAADVSDTVASRDLKALTECGLLVAKGEKRGRYYEASPSVVEIRERVAEPKAVADPFIDPSVLQPH
jgi:Fic family protein